MPAHSSSGDAHPDFLLLCLRVPKTGSWSLDAALSAGLAGRRNFFVPNTLDLDGRHSRFQRLRFLRGQVRNLLAYYGTPSLGQAFRYIDRHARGGELLRGGHCDFQTVQNLLSRRVKIITVLRNPYDRCRSEYHYARVNHLRKSRLCRLDSSTIPQVAAKCDFESYLDFLLEHRDVYGNIASSYLGIQESDDIGTFFRRHVFHAGVLEQSANFAETLGEKLGQPVEFPHLNQTGSGDYVPLRKSTKSKIERLYARDFAIYDHVLFARCSHRRPAITPQARGASHGYRSHAVPLNGSSRMR